MRGTLCRLARHFGLHRSVEARQELRTHLHVVMHGIAHRLTHGQEELRVFSTHQTHLQVSLHAYRLLRPELTVEEGFQQGYSRCATGPHLLQSVGHDAPPFREATFLPPSRWAR